MRWWLKVLIPIVAIGVIAAATYAELVLDIRAPRSNLTVFARLTGSSSFLISDVNRRSKELNQQFGNGAQTSIVPGGELITRIDGKVVHKEIMKGDLAKVTGIVVVGSAAENNPSIFPFNLGLDNDPISASRGLVGLLNREFGGDIPAKLLAFEESDFSFGDCFKLSASDLGLGSIGALLRLKSGRACLVSWKGSKPGSMLVSLTLADGDPWMRPFANRFCRLITASALQKMGLTHRNPPDYGACMLADRPDRIGVRDMISLRIYEVRPNGVLATVGR